MTAKPNKNNRQRKALSENQKLFVEYLADPGNGETPEEFAKRLSVSEKTLLEWKSEPVIVQSVYQLCVTRFGTEKPKVLKMLFEKALKDKDIAACKLFFQQIDKITDIPETGISVDDALQIVNTVLEGSKTQ